MDHTGHRERLRQRYQREGLDGFAPHEVLELLLTFAIPRVDTNPLAHELIDRFGSLSAVMEASPAELEQVPGIGRQASTLLTMLLPVFRAYQQEKLKPRGKFDTYANVAAYCRTLYLGSNEEQFYVLSLDAGLNLLAVRRLSEGSPAQVSAHPRAVVQELIRHNAVCAVITHNHPSGSALPSQDDLEVTRSIQTVLDGVGIRLCDHVIIAGCDDYSFFANGLLGGQTPAPNERTIAADSTGRVSPFRGKKK